MLGLERQRQLLQHIRSHGAGNVTDLAVELGVSASTVRRDLKTLEDRGLLTRVHGGASIGDETGEPVFGARGREHDDEKRRIGEAAAALIGNGASVLITGGTTTEAILPHLADRTNLTIITNGLNVALQLSRYPGISVVVLGGVLRHSEMSLLGQLTEHALADFRVDLAVTGAFGIDAEYGIFGADVREASTDRSILRQVPSLVVVADASKFHQRGPVRVVGTEHVTHLVTDDGAPAEAVAAWRAHGVDVVLA
jgi:DeoR/GlpR family transcriptional regulator of sugar metabolism